MAPPTPVLRFARYGAVAYELSGVILAGAALGWAIDRWLDTAPFGILVCTLTAIVGGFVRLVVLLRRFDRLDRTGAA